MKIRALVSFSGALTMFPGEEMECNDKVVLQDLLNAGYIEEVQTTPKSKRSVKKSASK